MAKPRCKLLGSQEARVVTISLLSLGYPLCIAALFALLIFVALPLITSAVTSIIPLLFWLVSVLVWILLLVIFLPLMKDIEDDSLSQYGMSPNKASQRSAKTPLVQVEPLKENRLSLISYKTIEKTDLKDNDKKTISSENNQIENDQLYDYPKAPKNLEEKTNSSHGSTEKIKIEDTSKDSSSENLDETKNFELLDNSDIDGDSNYPVVIEPKSMTISDNNQKQYNSTIIDDELLNEDGDCVGLKPLAPLPRGQKAKPSVDTSRASRYYECNVPVPMTPEKTNSNIVFFYINPENKEKINSEDLIENLKN